MSSYRSVEPVSLLAAASMSGTNVNHSSALDIGHLVAASFYVSWTGTPVGTFTVEGSLDNVKFAPLQDVSIPDAAGSADSRLINLFWLAFKYVRVTYTNSSGSGVLSVVGMAKGA